MQFTPGQLVLKFNGRNEIKPSKFKVKWLGPFKVHEVGANRAIKLWTLDDKEIPDAVNDSKLKVYQERPECPDRENWKFLEKTKKTFLIFLLQAMFLILANIKMGLN